MNLFCRHLLSGLEHLHRSGIVHGNVEIGNVFVSITRDPIWKIGKFKLKKVETDTFQSDLLGLGRTVMTMATRCDPDKLDKNWASAKFLDAPNNIREYNWVRWVPTLLQLVEKCLTSDSMDHTSSTQLLSHPFIINNPWAAPECEVGEFCNKHLCTLYTRESETFYCANLGMELIIRDLWIRECRKLREIMRTGMHPNLLYFHGFRTAETFTEHILGNPGFELFWENYDRCE